MIVGLILARGGSKRLPGKNMREVGNKTLVARAIECAFQCAEIDAVVLSTDDDVIALEGWREGAIIVRRPAHLATDTATSEEAAQHALSFIGDRTATVVLLQPTSPLRKADDVQKAIRIFREGGAPSVATVNERMELNGAVYVTSAHHIWDHNTFTGAGTEFVVMPDERSVDVDTAAELALAQVLDWDG